MIFPTLVIIKLGILFSLLILMGMLLLVIIQNTIAQRSPRRLF